MPLCPRCTHCPTPAGPQPLALAFELWNAAGNCGAGALLGATRLPLSPLAGLKERTEQAADVELGQVRGMCCSYFFSSFPNFFFPSFFLILFHPLLVLVVLLCRAIPTEPAPVLIRNSKDGPHRAARGLGVWHRWRSPSGILAISAAKGWPTGCSSNSSQTPRIF